jgi:alanine racemase
MTNYSISDIADAINGNLHQNSGAKIQYLLIDSRKVLFARESLFFALRGIRNDGHRFIPALYKSGVRNFVADQLPENPEEFPRANFILVENTLHSLHKLIIWHRNHMQQPVLGVTGSNGKTIVKEWLYQCLHKDGFVVRNPKSFNSQVGVPLSVWLLNPEASIGIFEAGISMPGEMAVLEKMIQPTVGIFTNIGDAHQENFESQEQKVQEKLKLFKNAKSIIYCADHEMIHLAIQESPELKNKKFFSWGKNSTATLQITKLEKDSLKTKVYANYKGRETSITLPFQSKAPIENAMHVWCFLLMLEIPDETIQKRLYKLENVAMRLELKAGINNCTLINDTYNSDIESVKIALDFLDQQHQHPQRILILSDILQSGYQQKALYQEVSQIIAAKKVDRLIGIGPSITEHADLFSIRKDFFEDTEDFLARFPFSKITNATILLKGARRFQFEAIEKALNKKSHRTVFEINLNALEHNINYFKSRLKPNTGIIAMVKAFSYGSGSHEIANICQYQNVAALAVAYPDEGVELRKNGIQLPIMVMNPEQDNYQTLIDFGLEPEIFSFNALENFIATTETSETSNYPIHIKLDTGMHRSGFLEHEIDNLITILKNHPALKVKTVFSHLAGADEATLDDFTHQQAATFIRMAHKIQQALSYPIERHILNSAGIERFPEYQFNYVRLGIGMYGISADNAPLATVGCLKSAIAQIKNVSPGDTIGYNRKGQIAQPTNIATVTIGYADGYNRLLSNGKGKVYVNGKFAPTIGNICMDMCMIDVTGLNAKEGDEVELIGPHVNINKMAEELQTIPYEILTSISQRVKRIYLYE